MALTVKHYLRLLVATDATETTIKARRDPSDWTSLAGLTESKNDHRVVPTGGEDQVIALDPLTTCKFLFLETDQALELKINAGPEADITVAAGITILMMDITTLTLVNNGASNANAELIMLGV